MLLSELSNFSRDHLHLKVPLEIGVSDIPKNIFSVFRHHAKLPAYVITYSLPAESTYCGSCKRVCLSAIIHSFSSLTTGPKPLPKPALHTVRSRASSFKWQYPLPYLRSSSSFLHLLSRLLVTSIPHFIFPSITPCRRQFLRKMWPIQLAFRLLISCRIFLCSLTVSNTSSFLTWSVQLIFYFLLQHHISKLSKCFWSTARSIQVSAPYKAMLRP